MADKRSSYKDGELIYREGDLGRCAYLIETGLVVLSAEGLGGGRQIAELEAGALFGELGLFDDSIRLETARARGRVKLLQIERGTLLKAIVDDQPKAADILSRVVHRLTLGHPTANPVNLPAPVGETAPASASAAKPKRPGLFARLFGGAPRPATRTATIEVLVADIVGDEDRQQVLRLVDILQLEGVLRARAHNKSLAPSSEDDLAHQLAGVVGTGRQWLRASGADLLIFGHLNHEGQSVRLRFLSGASDDDDRPGSFSLINTLEIPIAREDGIIPLLQAVALAATVPRVTGQVQLLRVALPQLLDQASGLAEHPPLDLDQVGQASIKVCYGNAAAIAGYTLDDLGWLKKSRHAYHKGTGMLARSSAQLDWAAACRQLGNVLMAIAEKSGDNSLLGAAIEALNNALEVLTRETLPWPWTLIQLRLGSLYYRLDQMGADDEALKKACAAYGAALSVLNETDHPVRWADAKQGFAQSLQVLGGQMHNAELIERAISFCYDALRVRTREGMPFQWGATQNTLGSALFLLGRQNYDREAVEQAGEAFRNALDVYTTLEVERAAKVARRNLQRVEDALVKVRAHQAAETAPKFEWPEEDENLVPESQEENQNNRKRK